MISTAARLSEDSSNSSTKSKFNYNPIFKALFDKHPLLKEYASELLLAVNEILVDKKIIFSFENRFEQSPQKVGQNTKNTSPECGTVQSYVETAEIKSI